MAARGKIGGGLTMESVYIIATDSIELIARTVVELVSWWGSS